MIIIKWERRVFFEIKRYPQKPMGRVSESGRAREITKHTAPFLFSSFFFFFLSPLIISLLFFSLKSPLHNFQPFPPFLFVPKSPFPLFLLLLCFQPISPSFLPFHALFNSIHWLTHSLIISLFTFIFFPSSKFSQCQLTETKILASMASGLRFVLSLISLNQVCLSSCFFNTPLRCFGTLWIYCMSPSNWNYMFFFLVKWFLGFVPFKGRRWFFFFQFFGCLVYNEKTHFMFWCFSYCWRV